MTTVRTTMTMMLIIVLHVAPVWGVTMAAQDMSALMAMRGAIENKEKFPSIYCNHWIYFRCDGSGRVKEIHLISKGLKGKISPAIVNLTKLERLELNDNQLSGSIPTSITQMTSLLSLYLNNNKLSGSIPWSIGRLKSLYYLSLSHNQLSGNIPWSIGNLTSIVDLRLDHNRLSGIIPSSINRLRSLQFLKLDNNLLSGIIPSSIGNLTALGTIYLGNNQLTGGIPSSILRLKHLGLLDITNNYFVGPITRVKGVPYCMGLVSNCLFGSKLPSGCGSKFQRSKSVCDAFCHATQWGGPCGGNGICSNSKDGKTRACACNRGYINSRWKYTCQKVLT